jgi:hypothetical protein
MNHMMTRMERPARATKTYAKPSRKSFSLGLDTLTHLTLVELQKNLASPRVNPSRTLVVRRAVQRYGQEMRSRLANGDGDWLDTEAATIGHLAQNGPKS